VEALLARRRRLRLSVVDRRLARTSWNATRQGLIALIRPIEGG
jgi:hypothetical protein